MSSEQARPDHRPRRDPAARAALVAFATVVLASLTAVTAGGPAFAQPSEPTTNPTATPVGEPATPTAPPAPTDAPALPATPPVTPPAPEPVPGMPDAPIQMVAPAPPPEPYEAPSRLRPLGFAMMGVGTIALGTGAIFGLRAISQKKDAGCSGTDCSNAAPGSGDTLRGAQSTAAASTVCFVGGGLLAITGVVLFFFTPRTGNVRASAHASPSGGGMTLEKAF